MKRIAKVKRKTKETKVDIVLNIDGNGRYKINVPLGFFTHMLESFAKQGLFNLKMSSTGDLEVDQHHLVEDCGITLGQAFNRALGKRKGINRAGYFAFPMDDALAIVAVDVGGRPYLNFDVKFRRRFCGDLDTDLIEEFFYGFSVALGANIAIKMPYGKNDHHKIEAIFKAFGKAMRMACSVNKKCTGIPSTKGVLR